MTPVELTEFLGVLAAIGSSIVVPVYLNRRKERVAASDVTERGDANLRDDQREFIRILQDENAMWRRHAAAQDDTISRLHERVANLEAALAIEQQARHQSEAKLAAKIDNGSHDGEEPG